MAANGRFSVPAGVGYPTPAEALAALKAAGILTLPDRAVRELFRLAGDQARRAEVELARIVRANKGIRETRKRLLDQQRAARNAVRAPRVIGESTGLRPSRPETPCERAAREARRDARRMTLLMEQGRLGAGGRKAKKAS